MYAHTMQFLVVIWVDSPLSSFWVNPNKTTFFLGFLLCALIFELLGLLLQQWTNPPCKLSAKFEPVLGSFLCSALPPLCAALPNPDTAGLTHGTVAQCSLCFSVWYFLDIWSVLWVALLCDQTPLVWFILWSSTLWVLEAIWVVLWDQSHRLANQEFLVDPIHPLWSPHRSFNWYQS
jgi:hypothetical protein